MKTNKSFQKRLKITKSGKIIGRKSGQSHFNAKERHNSKTSKGQGSEFHMSNKNKSRFLVNF
ncbi:MAG TPA: 50S ribosomal protein L35 [Candidatus Paceibacterota bacterium]